MPAEIKRSTIQEVQSDMNRLDDVQRYRIDPQTEQHLDPIVKQIPDLWQQIRQQVSGLGYLTPLKNDDIDSGVTNLTSCGKDFAWFQGIEAVLSGVVP